MGSAAENIVYKAKALRGRAVFMIILAVILFVISIGLFALRGAKNEKTTMRSGYQSSSGEIVWFDERSGYIDGQAYVLTEEGRQAVLLCGCAGLILAFFFLFGGIGTKRCRLEMYETHVEGQSFRLAIKKQEFNLPYEDIESISCIKNMVIIKSGVQYAILCSDAESAYRKLKLCCHKE